LPDSVQPNSWSQQLPVLSAEGGCLTFAERAIFMRLKRALPKRELPLTDTFTSGRRRCRRGVRNRWRGLSL